MKKFQNYPAALGKFMACALFVTLYGCGKPTGNPTPNPVNPTGCAIASDVDQALGVRNFEYDDKGFLVKMTGPAYYYGPFVRTITPAKVVDSYPTSVVDGLGNHYNGTINIDFVYTGGSGSIYNGDPEYVHQLFSSTNSASPVKTDSLYKFTYDAKKHLTKVQIRGNGNVKDADGYSFLRTELQFTYDGNDNVTQVKIVYVYEKRFYAPDYTVSRIDSKDVSDEWLTIAYDDKLSPYTSISKYWKLTGNDISGYEAYNLDKVRFWANRCATMSKNNPVKITGKVRTVNGSPATDISATITYQYNDKNLPVSMAMNGAGINAFTYKCK